MKGDAHGGRYVEDREDDPETGQHQARKDDSEQKTDVGGAARDFRLHSGDGRGEERRRPRAIGTHASVFCLTASSLAGTGFRVSSSPHRPRNHFGFRRTRLGLSGASVISGVTRMPIRW